MPLGTEKAGLLAAAAAAGAGDRGLFGGGWSYGGSANIDSIEYVTISSTGNGTDFGDLLRASAVDGTANGTSGGRGVWHNGHSSSPLIGYQYVTIQTLGNAADFGDQNVEHSSMGAGSNGSNDRGLFVGGRAVNNDPLNDDSCEYITISSTGNGTDFGNLVEGRSYTYQTATNGTDERLLTMGGEGPGSDSGHKEIDYFTISSTGNASDFGDMSPIMKAGAATSNDTNDRMVIFGGNLMSNETTLGNQSDELMAYVTITSLGNTTEFGDLAQGRTIPGAASNGVNERGVVLGGYFHNGSYSDVDDAEYITISSTGNASSFGDCTAGHQNGGFDDCQA